MNCKFARSDPNREIQSLRLASYNVRKAIGLDRRRNPSRILEVISSLDADIVALQEADKRLGQRVSPFDVNQIVERTGLVPADLGGNKVSLGWHGNALLVHPDITISSIKLLSLPGLEPRGAISASLQLKYSSVRIMATHLGLTRRSRQKQCDLIHHEINASNDSHSIILGDFNEWRSVGSLEALTRSHHILSPGHSFHASRPFVKLDRFALSKGLKVQNTGIKLSRLSKIASDHLPVWVDIRLE